MKYTLRTPDSRDPQNLLYSSLEPVAQGLGMALLELSLFQSKGRKGRSGSVQIKVTAYKRGTMGLEDCSCLHRAILPRLELAFPRADLSLEVSSPGIGRLIKDGNELVHLIGRGVKCYMKESAGADSSGWIGGILSSVDEKGFALETQDGKVQLSFENVAKAKLDEALDINQ
jgi:ribosome maturation factor RimP